MGSATIVGRDLSQVQQARELESRIFGRDACEDLDVLRSAALPLEEEVPGRVGSIGARRRDDLKG